MARRSLQWDPALAASASAYAQQLARGGPFVHAPRAGRENERENLSRGLPGASPERMMENWTGEKRNFIPGILSQRQQDRQLVTMARITPR